MDWAFGACAQPTKAAVLASAHTITAFVVFPFTVASLPDRLAGESACPTTDWWDRLQPVNYFFCVASLSTRSRRSFKGSGFATGPLSEKSISMSVLGE